MNIVYIDSKINFQNNKYYVDFVISDKKGKFIGRQIIKDTLPEAQNVVARLEEIRKEKYDKR